jgi:hypothetical protein
MISVPKSRYKYSTPGEQISNDIAVGITIRERERGIEFRGEGSERHYQVVVGGVGNSSCCLEGSQALPASPYDRVGFVLKTI